MSMTVEPIGLVALGVPLWLYTAANFLGVGRQPMRGWFSTAKVRWCLVIIFVGVLAGIYLRPEQLLSRLWLPLLSVPLLALVNRYIVYRKEPRLTLWFLLKQCYFEVYTVFALALLVGNLPS